MIFNQVLLDEGVVYATAEGHPTEVMERFRDIAAALLGNQGAWRITYAHGECDKSKFLETQMAWELIAQRKADMDGGAAAIKMFPVINIRLV